MKTILTAFLLLFMGNNLMAQIIQVDTLSINLSSPKAKLLYNTDKGLVYALPLDNMRCLVPTIKSDMPVADSDMHGYIPNPLLKEGKKPIITIPLENSSFFFQKEINFPNSQTFHPFQNNK